MTDWVVHPPALTGNEYVGCYLQPVDWQAGHFHAGLLYRGGPGQVWTLHLAFHEDLRREEVLIPSAGAVVPKLRAARAKNVAALAKRVWTRSQTHKIPYGLRFNASRFSFAGDFVLGQDEHGLTCATFLLALFAAAGVNLLDCKAWPEREEDKKDQERLVELLHREGHVEQAARVQNDVGAPRFRPAEVVAAASVSPPACGFDESVKRADQLLSFMRGTAAAPT